jgi:trans-aconitate 2-methyltransferase
MAWSPAQYLKFEDERTRPARDLLAQVPLEEPGLAIDMGCGPGNSTELIADRFPQARVEGMDSDENMLEAARKRLPGLTFSQGDLETWLPAEKAGLLYANAVFQWVPEQLAVLKRLMAEGLKPGGVLAIQMPDNLTEPTHRLMEETALSGPWADRFSGGKGKRPLLPGPADYLNALTPLSSRVDLWHTVYYHPLANAEAIVEWVKGTGLRPWLDLLEEKDRPAYLEAYTEAVRAAYPPLDSGRVLLRFPRLFVVATRA